MVERGEYGGFKQNVLTTRNDAEEKMGMSSELCAFTISSFNYLAQAAVLRESFLRHHPEAKFYIFLCDRIAGRDLPLTVPGCDVIEAGELGIPSFDKMCYVYDLTELNTAVKPFCFLYLFERKGVPFAFYIDPDIYFYSAMEECGALVEGGVDIILTPHTSEPVEDAESPNDYDFAKAGIYNLGFCGVRNSPNGRSFTAWWARKLEDDCRIDLANGIFVDQKWCDGVPALFDRVAILRHNGYNVAYWNMVHRAITVDSRGNYLANGVPLRFFHFSGVSMNDYKIVSKHQKRLNYDNIGAFGRRVFTEYRMALMEHKYFHFITKPFMIFTPMAFASLDTTRGYVQQLGKLTSGANPRLPSIDDFWSCSFQGHEQSSFGPIPDFLFCIYQMRADVRAHCGDLDLAAGRRSLIGWAHSSLAAEMPLITHNTQTLVTIMLDSLVSQISGDSRRFDDLRNSYFCPSIETCSNEQGVLLPFVVEAYLQARVDLKFEFNLRTKQGRRNAQTWFLRYFEAEVGSTNATTNLVKFVLSLTRKGILGKIRYANETFFSKEDRAAKIYLGSGLKKVINTGKQSKESFRLFNTKVSPRHTLLPGVCLIGYPGARMGMGEHIRNTASALEFQAVDYEIFSFDPGLRCDNSDTTFNHKLSHVPQRKINIFHINADQCLTMLRIFGPGFLKGRYNIGFWAWELDVFPEELVPAIDMMDELWAPSNFVRFALQQKTAKPVVTMPLRVESSKCLRDDNFVRFDEAFSFLFFFDFNSYHERKNPWAIIEAFSRAFPIEKHDKAQLLIKTIGHELHSEDFARLHEMTALDSRITLITDVLSQNQMCALINATSCFVSLHRAEGFGRGMAEAMALGKPVIATGYSGNMDFMTPENSYPVDYSLVDVKAGEYPYLGLTRARWASPNLEHAIKLMRHVFENQNEASRKGEKARSDIERNHSSLAVSAKIIQRLTALGSGLID